MSYVVCRMSPEEAAGGHDTQTDRPLGTGQFERRSSLPTANNGNGLICDGAGVCSISHLVKRESYLAG